MFDFIDINRKITCQCFYCWRYYCHCKPSNFGILRATARPDLSIIRENFTKYNSYGKTRTRISVTSNY